MTRAKGTPDETEKNNQAKKPPKIIKVQSISDEVPADVASTAEEVNASLKAMAPDLGNTVIEPVQSSDADDELSGEVAPMSDELIDEVEALEEVDDQADMVEAVQSSEGDQTSNELTPDSSDLTINIEPSLEELDDNDLETSLDDPITDKAIDDIVAEESDKVLEAEDAERAASDEKIIPKKTRRLKELWQRLWSSPAGRWGLVGGAGALLILAILAPPSRYFLLNTVGVRSSLSLRVVDNGTMQPLKNVKVSVAGVSGQTDSDGTVKLDKLKLGRTNLLIEKRAFSNLEQPITVGWGSNPLGDYRVTAVGSQYTFYIKDLLSDKAVEKVEATSGDGNASSDSEGKLVLTLDTAEMDDNAEIIVELKAENYRTEKVKITVNNKEAQSIKVVPSRKHVFVSKRSGKYDVYTVYVDGKDETKIVPGTGLEREDITLLPHQHDDVAALVSTRENVRNSDGYLLSTLYVVDTASGELVKIDQSEQIQLIGWSKKGRLIYVKIAAGASGANPKRHRLMSFNSQDYADVKELSSSNSFNDVLMADEKVYFAPSNIFNENASAGLYVINPNGESQQTLLDKEVYNIFRSAYDVLDISTGASWYTYTIGSGSQAKVGGAPSSQYSKIFADNHLNNFSLWVDSRDGKGVLLNYDRSTKSDTVLVDKSGVKTPVYWLNEKYAVYRVNDGKETADYVINIEGGDPKKIKDVTDTNGVDRWFYY